MQKVNTDNRINWTFAHNLSHSCSTIDKNVTSEWNSDNGKHNLLYQINDGYGKTFAHTPCKIIYYILFRCLFSGRKFRRMYNM